MKNTTNPANEKGQEYKLPDGLQDDMLELNKEVKKSKDRTSIFSRPATYLTMLTTALTMTAASPAFSQTPDKIPTFSIEMVKNYPSLKYIVDNFDKHFKDPEMKKHLEEMIATLGSRKEGVELALKLTTKKFKDVRMQLLCGIWSIEEFVVFDNKFENKYEKEYDNDTLLLTMEEFNKIYDEWTNAEIEKLNKILSDKEKTLADKGKELANARKETDEILKSFSVQQVKKNPNLQKALIKFKSTLEWEDISKLSAHTQELLNLVP